MDANRFTSTCQYCARRYDCSLMCGTFTKWFPETWDEMCKILRKEWGLELKKGVDRHGVPTRRK